ncbi:unnamed protein product [Oikopleura dioica]|uniref:Uncharacterized protein n=1 Tax=Oikopleura dioica TaxID=34765 RepID=E4XJA5_OIKDI|nr:unnamed protein product [Oikopleura dioica]
MLQKKLTKGSKKSTQSGELALCCARKEQRQRRKNTVRKLETNNVPDSGAESICQNGQGICAGVNASLRMILNVSELKSTAWPKSWKNYNLQLIVFVIKQSLMKITRLFGTVQSSFDEIKSRCSISLE